MLYSFVAQLVSLTQQTNKQTSRFVFGIFSVEDAFVFIVSQTTYHSNFCSNILKRTADIIRRGKEISKRIGLDKKNYRFYGVNFKFSIQNNIACFDGILETEGGSEWKWNVLSVCVNCFSIFETFAHIRTNCNDTKTKCSIVPSIK